MSQAPFIFSAGSGQSVPTLPGLSPQQTTQSTPASLTAPRQKSVMSATAAQQINAAAAQQNALMAALQGIAPEQLSIIVQALQSGQLPIPPVLPQTTATAATPTQAAIPHAQLPSYGPASVVDEQVDIDKEDGEVEEVSTIEQQHKITSPDRSAHAYRSESSVQERAESHSSQRHQTVNPLSHPRPNGLAPAQTNGRTDRRRGLNPHEASKRFVLAMHEAGYSFYDLASNVEDEIALKNMYRELHLPIPKRDITLSKDTLQTSAPLASSNQQNTAGVQSKHQHGPRTSRNETEDEKKQKRQEYLAKLQAARKKSAPSLMNTTAVKARTDAEPSPVKAATTLPSAKPAQPKAAPKSVAKITINREELQRRLKKLEAEQASKKERANNLSINAEVPSVQTTEQLDQSNATVAPALGLGSGLDNLAQQVEMESQRSPLVANGPGVSGPVLPRPQVATESVGTPLDMPPLRTAICPSLNTPQRSFSGLPGLSGSTLPGLSFGGSPFTANLALQSSYFGVQPVQEPNPSYTSPVPTNPAVVQEQAQTHPIIDDASPLRLPTAPEGGKQVPQEQQLPHDKSRKRVVASSFDDEIDDLAGDVPSKRMFGQSRHESTDEEMIIEVSDESEDGEHGEADADEARPDQTHGSIRDMPPLSDVPLKLHFTKQQVSSSTPGTPGSMTPGGLEYQRKMLELEEARRRLAELESRKKSKVIPNAAHTPSKAISPPLRTASAEAPSRTEVMTAEADLASAAVSLLPRSSSTHLDHNQGLFARREELERSKLELARRIATSEQKRAAGLQQTDVQPDSSLSAGNLSNGQKTSQPEAQSAYEQTPSPIDPPATDHGSWLPATDILISSAGQPVSTETDIPQEQLAPEPEGSDFGDLDDLYSNGSTSVPNVLAGADQDTLPDDDQPFGSDNEAIADDEYSPDENVSEDVLPDAPLPQQSHLDDAMISQSAISTSASSSSYHSEQVEDIGTAKHTVALDEPVLAPQQLSTEPRESETSKPESDDEGGPEVDDDSFATEDRLQYEPELAKEDSWSPGLDTAMTATVHEDLAPELRPQPETQAEAQNQAFPIVQQPKRYYTPYRSPLERFRDFRYHPNYTSIVSGGHQSLTYSHKIDAHTPLCQFESSGGSCNDPACPDQHFRDMVLNDTEIVQQLGTDYPNHHPEVKVEYNKGLRDIISDMKAAGLINNVAAIAPHLVHYRQQFLQDPSKIIDFEYWQARAKP